MRRSLALGMLALAAAVAVSSVAEAGSRRMRNRRGADKRGAFVAAASDEAVQAIVAATPTGGVAQLPTGRYRTTLVIDRPMTVVASSLGTWIDATGLAGPAVRIAPGVEDVVLDGLRVVSATAEGVLAEGGNHRLALRRVQCVECAGDGARLVASDDVELDRCSFERCGGDGLEAQGRGLRATRTIFRRNLGAAAVLRGADARISESGFEGGAAGIVFDGKDIDAFRVVFYGVSVPVRFAAGADTCSAERCSIRGAVNAMVAETGSVYCRFAANRVEHVTGDAVLLQGTWHTVEANLVSAPAGCGVRAAGSSFRVAGNTFSDCGAQGVLLLGSGNMVDGNGISGAGAEAISVAGDGNVVAVNAIESPAGDGMECVGSANRIVANRVSFAGAAGIRVAGDANTVQDDVCADAVEEGIRVEGGQGNLLLTNRISRCGGAGLLDLGVETVYDRNQID